MSESRQEHQTATGGDGDGRVHSRFVKYSLLSRSFLTFPSSFPASSSFFYLYPPSAFHHVLALAISLILLLTLYYFVFTASTPFLQLIMPNFSESCEASQDNRAQIVSQNTGYYDSEVACHERVESESNLLTRLDLYDTLLRRIDSQMNNKSSAMPRRILFG